MQSQSNNTTNPMTTHQQATAEIINKQRNSYGTNWNANFFRALDDTCKAFADMYQKESNEFNRGLFLTSCGFETTGTND